MCHDCRHKKRFFMRRLYCVLVAATLSAADAVPKLDEIDAAIRSNDLVQLRQLVRSRETANIANGLKATPLHYAALYGSIEALAFLLEKGADPNSQNQSGATPLIYAAWSFERTQLLVE